MNVRIERTILVEMTNGLVVKYLGPVPQDDLFERRPAYFKDRHRIEEWDGRQRVVYASELKLPIVVTL